MLNPETCVELLPNNILIFGDKEDTFEHFMFMSGSETELLARFLNIPQLLDKHPQPEYMI